MRPRGNGSRCQRRIRTQKPSVPESSYRLRSLTADELCLARLQTEHNPGQTKEAEDENQSPLIRPRMARRDGGDSFLPSQKAAARPPTRPGGSKLSGCLGCLTGCCRKMFSLLKAKFLLAYSVSQTVCGRRLGGCDGSFSHCLEKANSCLMLSYTFFSGGSCFGGGGERHTSSLLISNQTALHSSVGQCAAKNVPGCGNVSRAFFFFFEVSFQSGITKHLECEGRKSEKHWIEDSRNGRIDCVTVRPSVRIKAACLTSTSLSRLLPESLRALRPSVTQDAWLTLRAAGGTQKGLRRLEQFPPLTFL